jgi:hypothetical protein
MRKILPNHPPADEADSWILTSILLLAKDPARAWTLAAALSERDALDSDLIGVLAALVKLLRVQKKLDQL